MVDLNGLRVELAGKLGAEGLPVTLDPRNVSPPVVVVGLPVVTAMVTPCVWAVDIDVHAVAPAPGNLDAVEWLLDTIAAVLLVTGGPRAEPTAFDPAPGSGAAPLPAYVCTVSTEATTT